MKQTTLPPSYKDIVRDGVAALRYTAELLEHRADREREPGETLLALRDVGGLAWRLECTEEWEWEEGFASLSLGGQDLAVLDSLIEETLKSSPYADDSTVDDGRRRGQQLAALRDFLARYTMGEFIARGGGD